MINKKKVLVEEHLPEFEESIAKMPEDSKIFVDKSLEIANYISQILQEKNLKQKDLADKLGKSEAEISKWLTGMHNFTLRSLSKLEAAIGATVICTPKNIKYNVVVTNIINMRSISTTLYKPHKNQTMHIAKLVSIKQNDKKTPIGSAV